MNLNFIIFCLYLQILRYVNVAEKFQYIILEHPTVTYNDPEFMNYVNVTSHRHGRHDPFYYVKIHMYLLKPWDNNVSVSFYFYEWLTNTYKRGFVEMHFKVCDLIHKDKFFGSALRQGKFAQPCPFPTGAYHLYNMTIPIKSIPPHFPFTKGRIYCNVSQTITKKLIANGHINMEIKEYNDKKKSKKT